MQLSDAMDLSQKNEQLLRQLIEASGTCDRTMPLCLRYLIAHRQLDTRHLAGVLNTTSLPHDTLLDLAADALCNADLIPDRLQAEQKADELLRKPDNTCTSCWDTFSDFPSDWQHDILFHCCCCCPNCDTIHHDLYQTNIQRQEDEFELVRYAVAFPKDFKRLLSVFSIDTLFRSRLDTGSSEGWCVMKSVIQAIHSHTPSADAIVGNYCELINASKQKPVSMARINHILDYSDIPDTIELRQIPVAMLDLNEPLTAGNYITEQIRKDIQASGVLAAESVLLDGRLTLIIFRQANHRFYPVPKELLAQFLPVFSNRLIRKFSLAPQALIASLRIWQQSHLFAETAIFPYRNVVPMLNKKICPHGFSQIEDDCRRFFGIRSGIAFADFYYNLLFQVQNDSATEPLFPDNWDLLAWYYYTPDTEGMVTASHSPRLFCVDTSDTQNSESYNIVHGAVQITIRFISGRSVQDCMNAFLSIAGNAGIQKWNCLALKKVLSDGYCFVCESGSVDYFFDLLHSWAERAAVSAKRHDIEIQVSSMQ